MKCVLMPRLLIPFVLAAAASVASAAAQQGNVPNALQGFAKNRDQPVRVEAASLEVRDRDRTAVFTGNVVVQQGDTTMRSKQLVIHYNLDADKGQDKDQAKTQAAKTQAAKNQATKTATDGVAPRQIERLEASGGVIVTTREQTATGDNGLFVMKNNTVTLSGNVVLMQGPNVLRGERLVVDLNSGVSRIEAGKGGSGRVQGLFVPGSEKSDKADSKTDAKPPRAPVSPLPLRGN